MLNRDNNETDCHPLELNDVKKMRVSLSTFIKYEK